MRVLSGRDPHHIVEAQFKAVARALRDAVALDPSGARGAEHEGQPVTAPPRGRPRLRLGQPALRGARPGARRGGRELTADRAAAAEARRAGGARRRRVRGVHGRAARGPRAEVIGRRLAGGRPVLGICVGMQVLFERGVEHGVETAGLGEWPGVVERLARARRAAHGLEHGGGARGRAVRRRRDGAVLLRALLRRREWSLHTDGRTREPLVTWCDARRGPFVAAVENGPLSATQFHPEKSGDAGAALLANWVRSL